MYNPTTRLLTILELLQLHGSMSGVDLAARLEVDVRTVRRYITMLQDMAIPVESERGRHGNYYLRPGYKLPPLMFGEDEALAITLGLLMTRRIGIGDATGAEGALAKVLRVLPETINTTAEALANVLVFDLPAARTTPDRDARDLLRDQGLGTDAVLPCHGPQPFERPVGVDPVDHQPDRLAHHVGRREARAVAHADALGGRTGVPCDVAGAFRGHLDDGDSGVARSIEIGALDPVAAADVLGRYQAGKQQQACRRHEGPDDHRISPV